MPLFLNPRFALVLLLGLPLLGGAMVHPKGATAFVMGAWAGILIVAPPLLFAMWILRLKSLPEILRPLIKLPILFAISIAVIYLTDTDVRIELQALGAGAMLWWARKSKAFI